MRGCDRRPIIIDTGAACPDIFEQHGSCDGSVGVRVCGHWCRPPCNQPALSTAAVRCHVGQLLVGGLVDFMGGITGAGFDLGVGGLFRARIGAALCRWVNSVAKIARVCAFLSPSL
jgi:hypothetical protein